MALASAFLVILSKNPVHSVLFLILTFCNATGILLIFGVEFLSIILIIIYVGAVAVLFLFVVMMLDIKVLNQKFKEKVVYLPISLLIGSIFLTEILLLISNSLTQKDLLNNSHYYKQNWIDLLDSVTNIETLGQILYTYYFSFFLIAGLILLIALIGAVSLTLKEKQTYNQDLFKQLSRSYKNAIFKYKK
jgi:NADH-quinone oxidoreductase subunit J